MLRKIALFPKGTIFFIVPFVALAEEKAEYLRNVWSDMFVGVKSFHGDDGGQALTEDIDIAVCTIERYARVCVCVCLCVVHVFSSYVSVCTCVYIHVYISVSVYANAHAFFKYLHIC